MDWKIVSNTHDLILLEKKGKNRSIRIEARLNKDKSWNIYKIYFDNNSKNKATNFVEEYNAQNSAEARRLVDSLKSGKELTISEIQKIKSEKRFVRIRRQFNEFNVEKWKIQYNKDLRAGFLIARYSDPISIDIVLNEQYKPFEQSILNEISLTLGLNALEEGVNQTIYYFTKKSTQTAKSRERKFVLGKIEFDVGNEMF